MTALASSLLAALPGGFAPFTGVGAAVSAGVGGAFEDLLAGLLAGEADARPRPPGLPDETQADAGQTAPDALLQPDSAFTVFAVAPAPPAMPLPAAVSAVTADSGATFTPADRAGIENGLPNLTAPLATLSSADADASNADAALAAQGWTRPQPPMTPAAAAAAAAATPAGAPPPAQAVTDRPDIETAALPAATTPAVPGKAAPARPDRAEPVRQTPSQPAAIRPADDQPTSVRPAAAPSTAALPAAPAIPAQPVSANPAQPAAPAVPPARTEVAGVDALPLTAPVKAVAPEGESRRPATASRGERLAQAAARPGLNPTAASDRPAPVETAAEALAAFDGDESEAIAPDAAPVDLAEGPEARSPALPAETRAAAVSMAGAVASETVVRGSPETVAKLAADIVRKLDGQTTRFDLELDPHGLGKVDVAIEIDRAGKMTAALTFDSAQSAADLRGRSGELRLALERAGFDVSEGGLTFDLAGQGPGFGGREAAQQERGWNGRAFQRAQSGAEEADATLAAATQPPSRTRSGIDIRI